MQKIKITRMLQQSLTSKLTKNYHLVNSLQMMCIYLPFSLRHWLLEGLPPLYPIRFLGARFPHCKRQNLLEKSIVFLYEHKIEF